jgi:hypothetical protein
MISACSPPLQKYQYTKFREIFPHAPLNAFAMHANNPQCKTLSQQDRESPAKVPDSIHTLPI